MMIIISVLIAVLVGSSCVWLMFEVLKHGSAVSFAESDQFDFGSQGATEMAEHCLQDGFDRESKKNLQNLLDSASLRPEIQEGGITFYTYGKKIETDNDLMQAADLLGGSQAITATDTMAVYKSTEQIQNRTYSIYIPGTQKADSSAALKVAAAVSCVALTIAVILSILFTNSFLIKFVFRKIEAPLDILTEGVRQIGSGNLNYRIAYTRSDEFLSVCDSFNEMAARLKVNILI